MIGNTENTYPWTKSSMSNGGGNGCVGWQWQPDGGLKVRDEKDPTGPVLTFTAYEATCFLDAIGKGELARPKELEA